VSFKRGTGSAAVQKRSPARHCACFTIRQRRRRVAEPRRLGGINRSQTAAALSPDTPDHPLNNVRDVCILLGQSINQVRRGQLAPRLATAAGYLASILLGALQQGPLEERLQRLEATLGLGNGQTDAGPNVESNTPKQN